MADQTPAIAQVEGPPPDLSPAITPPPVTIPGPDDMFAAIKERIKAANPQLDPDAPKPVEKAADDALPLNLDPKVMRTLGRLQKEVREAAPKLKEFDAIKPDAEFAKSIRDLWKGTPEQRLEALAKLSGRDGTDELAALVQFFYERDQATSAEANPDGTPKAQPSPETKALLDVVTELKKEVAALKEGGQAKTKAEEAAQAKANADAAAGFVGRFLTDNATKYEISARKENSAEAVDLVQSAVLTIALSEGLATKDTQGNVFMREGVTGEQANDLYHRAAASVEEEFENLGKRFVKPSTARATLFDPNKYARPLSRPSVVLKKEGPLPTNIPEREKALKERYEAMHERGEFKRS